MTTKKVHFVWRRYGPRTACFLRTSNPSVRWTTSKDDVTCGNCKGTGAYREA